MRRSKRVRLLAKEFAERMLPAIAGMSAGVLAVVSRSAPDLGSEIVCWASAATCLGYAAVCCLPHAVTAVENASARKRAERDDRGLFDTETLLGEVPRVGRLRVVADGTEIKIGWSDDLDEMAAAALAERAIFAIQEEHEKARQREMQAISPKLRTIFEEPG